MRIRFRCLRWPIGLVSLGLALLALVAMPMPAAHAGDFGTQLTFARNPADAAKLAKRDKKLAFFLHVSGNFEDSGFT